MIHTTCSRQHSSPSLFFKVRTEQYLLWSVKIQNLNIHQMLYILIITVALPYGCEQYLPLHDLQSPPLTHHLISSGETFDPLDDNSTSIFQRWYHYGELLAHFSIIFRSHFQKLVYSLFQILFFFTWTMIKRLCFQVLVLLTKSMTTC